MRYTSARKYPITKKKKSDPDKTPDWYIDLSVGTAAGLLGLVFLQGMIWGYMIKGRRK